MKRISQASLAIFAIIFSLFQIVPSTAYDVNRCLYLDGSNYVEAQRQLLPLRNQFTIEMWVYSDSSNSGKYAHFVSQGGRPSPFYLGLAPSRALRAGDFWVDTGFIFPQNEWTHLSYVRAASGKTDIYINGKLQVSNSGYELTESGSNTRFGGQYGASSFEFFKGCLDDIRIFNVTRTQDEIQKSMLLTTEQFLASSSSRGLILDYSFDQSNNYEAASRIPSQIQSSSGINGPSTDDLLAPLGKVKLIQRSELVSGVPLDACFTEFASISQFKGGEEAPRIVRIINRSNTDLTVELELSDIPESACIGLDLFIKGSPIPITSTVGIWNRTQTSRNRLNLDMTMMKCYYNKTENSNHPLILRPWYSRTGNGTLYGNEIDVPTCSNVTSQNPNVPSTILARNETISLLSNSTYSSKFMKMSALRVSALPKSYFQSSGAKNEWKVFEDWGCHAGPVNSTIEAFDQGVWKTITKSQGFEIDKNCPSTHPGRPFASISLENGQLFRWRIESGWIAYSPIRAYFSDEKVTSTIPLNVTEPEFKLISTNTTNVSPKPSTPTFSGINFSDNKVNISVNLGNNNANKPDKVYLVAPKLGFTSSNPNLGKIVGNTGTWSIDVNQLLPGTSIPLEVVSERSGTKSDSLYGAYRIPETQKITAVPEAPKKYSQRVVGTSMLIRVEVSQQNAAKANNVFLYSPTLNISKTKPIKGDIFGTEGIFEIPIKPSMVGKKYAIVIFLENSKGQSKPLNATLSIPGNPKLPSNSQMVPVPQQPKTVICLRSNQTRAFEGTTCPPGWSKK